MSNIYTRIKVSARRAVIVLVITLFCMGQSNLTASAMSVNSVSTDGTITYLIGEDIRPKGGDIFGHMEIWSSKDVNIGDNFVNIKSFPSFTKYDDKRGEYIPKNVNNVVNSNEITNISYSWTFTGNDGKCTVLDVDDNSIQINEFSDENKGTYECTMNAIVKDKEVVLAKDSAYIGSKIVNIPDKKDLSHGNVIDFVPSCIGVDSKKIIYKINKVNGFKFGNREFGSEGTTIVRTGADSAFFKITAYDAETNEILSSEKPYFFFDDYRELFIGEPRAIAFLDGDYVYNPGINPELKNIEISADLYNGLYDDSELVEYDTSRWKKLSDKDYTIDDKGVLRISMDTLNRFYDEGITKLTLRYTVKHNGYKLEHFCKGIAIYAPYLTDKSGYDIFGLTEGDPIGLSDGTVPSVVLKSKDEGKIVNATTVLCQPDGDVTYEITGMESDNPSAVKIERLSEKYWAVYGLKQGTEANITISFTYDNGKSSTMVCPVNVCSTKAKHNYDARFNDGVKILKGETKTIETNFYYKNENGTYAPYTGGTIEGKEVKTEWNVEFNRYNPANKWNDYSVSDYLEISGQESGSCRVTLKDNLPLQTDEEGEKESGPDIYVRYKVYVDGDFFTTERIKLYPEETEYYELTDGDGTPLKEINFDMLKSDYPVTMKVQKVSLGEDGKVQKEEVEGLKFTTDCDESFIVKEEEKDNSFILKGDEGWFEKEAIYVRAYNSTQDYEFVIDLVYTPRFDINEKISLDLFGVDDIEDQKYTGKDIYVPLKTYYKENDGGKDYDWSLVMGRDINVEYADNKEEGKATVTITGIGDYEGQIVKTFNIIKDNQSGGDNGGGSSGGDSGGSTGGGGGGAVAPAEPEDSNITNSGSQAGGDASTSVDVKDNTTVTEGKTETKVDADLGSKIVENAVENKSTDVVIKAETEQGSSSASTVALPASTIKDISDKTEASVTIKTDSAEVSLDKEAVAAVAAQAGTEGDVKLVVETKEAKDDQVVVELKIETSNGTVSNFNGGNVTVTVPVSEELASKTLVCVYIDENGVYTKVGGSLSSDKKTFVFTTGHFSTYAILEEAEADAIIAEQDKPAEEVTPVKVGKPAVKLYTYKGGKLRVKASAKNATGYKVYYKKSSWKKYKSYTKGNVKTLDKTFKKLAKGKYTVKVKAYNKAADGKLIVGAASKAKTITVKK